MSIYAIVTVQIWTVYIIKILERMLIMTVNLTLNEITGGGGYGGFKAYSEEYC